MVNPLFRHLVLILATLFCVVSEADALRGRALFRTCREKVFNECQKLAPLLTTHSCVLLTLQHEPQPECAQWMESYLDLALTAVKFRRHICTKNLPAVVPGADLELIKEHLNQAQKKGKVCKAEVQKLESMLDAYSSLLDKNFGMTFDEARFPNLHDMFSRQSGFMPAFNMVPDGILEGKAKLCVDDARKAWGDCAKKEVYIGFCIDKLPQSLLKECGGLLKAVEAYQKIIAKPMPVRCRPKELPKFRNLVILDNLPISQIKIPECQAHNQTVRDRAAKLSKEVSDIYGTEILRVMYGLYEAI